MDAMMRGQYAVTFAFANEAPHLPISTIFNGVAVFGKSQGNGIISKGVAGFFHEMERQVPNGHHFIFSITTFGHFGW